MYETNLKSEKEQHDLWCESFMRIGDTSSTINRNDRFSERFSSNYEFYYEDDYLNDFQNENGNDSGLKLINFFK